MKIYCFDEIDSTNTYAKELILGGSGEHFGIVIAKSQTLGRGRSGKSFVSADGGIYLTVMLDKNIIGNNYQPVFATGVCVSEIIDEIYTVNSGIKWVNDIILGRYKVCGILAENVSKSDFIIVGMGININTDKEYFKEIPHANSLKNITRLEVNIDDFTNRLISKLGIIYTQDLKHVIKRYKDKCITIGANVRTVLNGEEIFGVGKDILDTGELVIGANDGREIILNSGEAFIRGENGYI